MSPAPFSEALQRLLRDHLTSFEQLEIVLLLRREPAADWTVANLCERLRISEELIERALVGLKASGLASRRQDTSGFQYAPASPAIAQAVDELVEAHLHDHTTLLSTMSVNAIARIRSGPMRTFADAFIVNRKKGDG